MYSLQLSCKTVACMTKTHSSHLLVLLFVQIGGREVALNEVTDEMVAGMTEEERQLYTTLCQQAMSQLY